MDQAFAAGSNAGRSLGGLLVAALTGNRALKQQVYDATQQQMANQYRTAQEGRKYSVDADLGQNRLTALGQLKPAYAGAGLSDPQATLAATIANAAKDPGIGDMLASALKLGSVNRADAGNTQGANAMLAAVSGKPLDYTKIAGDTAYNPNATPDKSGMTPTQVGMGDITAKMAQAAASRASAANSMAGSRANDALARLRDVQMAAGGFSPHAMPSSNPSAATAMASPPGDATKTGDAYLATLPPAMRAVVKRIADGDQAPPSSSSRSPEAQALLQAVYTYDPTASAINLPARTATRKDFTSGRSANNIRSLNQAIGHLGVLLDQIPQVAGHKIPLVGQYVNAMENAYDEKSGDTGITNYKSTAEALAGEMTQVFRGNAGAEADIKRNLDHLDPSYSRAQKEEAAKNIIRLFNSRIQELGQQYSHGMGRSVDPYSLINPHAAEILKRVGVTDEAGPQGAMAGGDAKPATPTSEAEYNALPSGALFIDPDDGKTYRKP